eukprot:Rhum_TRINITY_DN25826_c0_g1::Rhum_TRINITY_DN25826_c0_g1_i1::g.182857::m.182857
MKAATRRLLLARAASPRFCSGDAVQARVLPCGGKATGTFVDGALREGTLLAADGTKRTGTFSAAGLLESGRVLLPDGRTFSGAFENGRVVAGRLEDGVSVYEGAFNERWQRHGQGKETFLDDKSTHEGQFVDDLLAEGHVFVPAADGEHDLDFTGTLRDGRLAVGTLKFQGMLYKGELLNDNPHGKGRLEMPDGSVREGRFQTGLLHGGGRIVLKNGTVLSGEFEEGVLNEGDIRWTDGDTYEGEMDEQHRPHGNGTKYSAAQGHWWAGQWAHGTFSGGSVTNNSGEPVDYRQTPPELRPGGI